MARNLKNKRCTQCGKHAMYYHPIRYYEFMCMRCMNYFLENQRTEHAENKQPLQQQHPTNPAALDAFVLGINMLNISFAEKVQLLDAVPKECINN